MFHFTQQHYGSAAGETADGVDLSLSVNPEQGLLISVHSREPTLAPYKWQTLNKHALTKK